MSNTFVNNLIKTWLRKRFMPTGDGRDAATARQLYATFIEEAMTDPALPIVTPTLFGTVIGREAPGLVVKREGRTMRGYAVKARPDTMLADVLGRSVDQLYRDAADARPTQTAFWFEQKHGDEAHLELIVKVLERMGYLPVGERARAMSLGVGQSPVGTALEWVPCSRVRSSAGDGWTSHRFNGMMRLCGETVHRNGAMHVRLERMPDGAEDEEVPLVQDVRPQSDGDHA